MYNQIKRKILHTISLLGEVTAIQISIVTGQTPEAASMALLRYHSMGLLNRRTLKGHTKAYTITQRGLERLRWLEAD